MFVLCARYVDDTQLVRHFLYDLFYFKSPRNHLLVSTVTTLWPLALPLATSALAQAPLVKVIVWCVFNTGPAQRAPEMRVREVQEDFIKMYGYKQNQTTAEDLVRELLVLAEEARGEEARLKELSRCLLLLGRCKDFVWVNNNIVMRLFKVLESSMAGGSQAPGLLCWGLSTLGLLARVYPAEGRTNLTNLFTQMTELVNQSSPSPAMERSAVRAIVHIGYHLQAQVRPASLVSRDNY